jgi:ribosomal protein S18 acetylase RimI-like enzyme
MALTSSQSYIVEDANIEDAAAIANILKKTWASTYPNTAFGISFNDITQHLDKFTPQTIASRIANQEELNRHYWKVCVDNQLAGICCALKDDANNVYTLLSLYIEPTYQNQGIGSALLRVALNWLGDDHDVDLGVATYNTNAISFYESFGFQITEPRHDEVTNLPSGKVIPEVTMVRKAKKSTD